MNQYGFVDGVPLGNTVSATQISTLQTCRYKWWLRYVRGLEPVKEASYLSLGKLIHEAIAYGVHNGGDFAGMISARVKEFLNSDKYSMEEIDMLIEMQDTALQIATMAIDELNEKYDVFLLDGKPAIELEFRVPLEDTEYVKEIIGFIDYIGTEKLSDRIWLLDHKVLKSFINEEAEQYNLQMSIYQYLLSNMGITGIVGSVYNQMSSKAMSTPSLNKNGTMSKVKIRCTWKKYMEALIENGLNPDDYESDMYPKLSENKFIKPLFAWRSKLELQNTWEQIVTPCIQQIESYYEFGRVSKLRNFNMMCSRCWAKEHCMGALRGDDIEFIENVLYQPIKHKDEEVVTDMEEVDIEEGVVDGV